MRIFGDYTQIDGLDGGSVVTIGNFDGVHRGHRALIDRVRGYAAQDGRSAVVLTFDPHPVRVLAPALAPPLICERDDKATLLDAAGVDVLLRQRFDRTFASLSPEAFVRSVLVDALRARRVIIGYDFTFGARRAGKTADLQRMGEALGFEVEVVSAQAVGDGLVASSTKVREFVLAGRMEGAAFVLGRPYHVNGVVQPGAQRGRTIGFPTANLAVHNELLPRQGVYAGWLDWGEGPRPAVINLGTNPTFVDDGPTTVEAHVIGADGLDLYGACARLFWSARLREERKFDQIEALVAQIGADRDAAAALLADLPPPSWP